MTETTLNSQSEVGLREFVKENEVKVYQFLQLMLFGFSGLEDVTLEVFRSFGKYFQRQVTKKNTDWEKTALRIELFSLAWEAVIRAQDEIEYNWSFGRDTRPLRQLDSNLLIQENQHQKWKVDTEVILPRLARVDIDFRAPMVLRDVLCFDDEEVIRILETRWGVYRHRLHRGRLAFRDSLRGRESRSS